MNPPLLFGPLWPAERRPARHKGHGVTDRLDALASRGRQGSLVYLSLAHEDLLDSQAQEDSQVFRASTDSRATRVLVVQKDCRVNLDPKERRVYVESILTGSVASSTAVQEDRPVRENPDLQDHLALLVFQDSTDPAALRENRGSLANQGRTLRCC
ncbi:hypothetical protein AALO_G00229390 [Alosa alosa]|uniref:Uncharacterized protein n=1 Tax=Alosa alosa TaxID=278164 RepID=A0AAV6FU73_9TELE|nr:hypothetical protein AALO_G00229390 [Alosa alosa]